MPPRKTNLSHVEDCVYMFDYLGITGYEKYVYGLRFKHMDYSIRVIISKRHVSRGNLAVCLCVTGHTNHKSPYPREIQADYVPPSMELLIRDLMFNRKALHTQS